MKKTFTEIQLERIANALEKLVMPQEESVLMPGGFLVKPILTAKEETKEKEVEELAKEEPLEAPEAEKEPKEETLIKEEEAEKLPEEVAPQVVPLKEVVKEPEVKEKLPPKEEPKIEPVKKAGYRPEKPKHRINPYRLEKEPKKGAVSGFRIKE